MYTTCLATETQTPYLFFEYQESGTRQIQNPIICNVELKALALLQRRLDYVDEKK